MWQDCAVADGGMRRNAAIELSHRRRRRWLSLGVTGAGVTGAGVTGVVAAGAIAGILTSGSPGGGVAHTVVTPAALGAYKWAPDLEKNAGLSMLATSAAKTGGGQMSDSRARTYEKPALGGAAPQLLEVIGGRLPSTSPASSIITLIQKYPSAHIVPAGPMGGSAACFEQTAGTADSVAMCTWSDNDTFGILASPTLNAADLANLMVQDRPLIELVKK
jgi:hypothetical protein